MQRFVNFLTDQQPYNVEVLKSSAASTVTLTSNVSPTEFNFANAANDVISFNDDYSQASTVNLYGDVNSGDSITNNSNITLTVIATTADLAAGGDASDDSPLTITGSATATDSSDTDISNQVEWKIGEEYAQELMNSFFKYGLKDYKEGRNFPEKKNVSRLSPYIHWGQISPNTLWHNVQNLRKNNGYNVVDFIHVSVFCEEIRKSF